MTFRVSCKAVTWELSDAQVSEWQRVYRHLDVEAECRKAWAWLDANPSRLKTARGMKRFLVGWLNRATPQARSTRHIPVRQYRWTCLHEERCEHPAMCGMKDLMPDLYPKRDA